jgi:hypothetical protein
LIIQVGIIRVSVSVPAEWIATVVPALRDVARAGGRGAGGSHRWGSLARRAEHAASALRARVAWRAAFGASPTTFLETVFG